MYRERFFWGCVIVVILFFSTSYQIFLNMKYGNVNRGCASEAKIISNILSPADRVYTDSLSIKCLEFFWHYPDKLETINFDSMDSKEEVPTGSYVYIHQSAVNWLDLNAGMGGEWLSKSGVYKKPYFYNNVPLSWEKVWQNDVASLYHVE